MSSKAIKVHQSTTDRGFVLIRFVDRYDQRCSLQESSLATEACIWLGCDSDRMHLTQYHVKALLPALQHFAETGALPSPEAKGAAPKDQREAMRAAGFTGDACSACHSMALVRTGTCATCQACGTTTGCS